MADGLPQVGAAAPTPLDIEQNLQSMERFQQSDPTKRYRWRATAYQNFGVDQTEQQKALRFYRQEDLAASGSGLPPMVEAARYAITTPGGQEETLQLAKDTIPHLGAVALGGVGGRLAGQAAMRGLESLPALGEHLGVQRLLPWTLPGMGQAAGEAGGEVAAQKMGFAPPDDLTPLIVGGAGAAGEAITSLGRAGVRFRPSRSYQLANEGAFADTLAYINTLAPPQRGEALLNAARSIPFDPANTIPTPRTFQALPDMMQRLQDPLARLAPGQHSRIEELLNRFRTLVTHTGGLQPQEMADYLPFLRKLNPEDDVEKAVLYGADGQPGLLSSLRDDLAQAASSGNRGAQLLYAGRQYFGQQRLVDDLTEMAMNLRKSIPGSQDAIKFSPSAMRDRLEKTVEDWQMPAEQRTEFVTFLEHLNSKGLLAPTTSGRAHYEAARHATALGVGGAAGGYSYSSGDDPFVSAGKGIAGATLTAGMLATPAFFRNLFTAALTSPGRAAIREVTAGQNAWTPATVSLVSALAAAQTANPHSEMFMPPRMSEILEQPVKGEPVRGVSGAMQGASQPDVFIQKPIPVILKNAGKKHGLDGGLLEAMASVESNNNPNAQSHKGALGLLQMMPATAKGLGLAKPEELIGNPELAADLGAKYMKQLLVKFNNNVPLALAAYNAGPTNVSRHGNRIPPLEETRHYITKVMERWRGSRQKAPEE